VATSDPPGAPYIDDFNAAGAKYGIDPWLLYEVARQESGFNPDAKSKAGAVGLMQFEPATAAGIGVNPSDPKSSIDGAAKLLAGYEKEFGSQTLALAAYNAGSGNVRKYGGVPPFTETQEYVSIINGRVAADIKKAGKKATVDANGNVTIEPSFWGLHWRDLNPLQLGKDARKGAGNLVKSAVGSVVGDVERPVIEAVIVLGGVGVIAVGVYVAVTGHRPHPVDTAKNAAQQVTSSLPGPGGGSGAGGAGAAASGPSELELAALA
jgi:hypothetical protein